MMLPTPAYRPSATAEETRYLPLRTASKPMPLLLKAGIDVNHVNNLSWTCLLEIVILGDGGPRHQEVARLVLAADPNLADKDGVTPLAHARSRGQREVATIIEAAGGRVPGHTPLM